jgi:hypothetical protein
MWCRSSWRNRPVRRPDHILLPSCPDLIRASAGLGTSRSHVLEDADGRVKRGHDELRLATAEFSKPDARITPGTRPLLSLSQCAPDFAGADDAAQQIGLAPVLHPFARGLLGQIAPLILVDFLSLLGRARLLRRARLEFAEAFCDGAVILDDCHALPPRDRSSRPRPISVKSASVDAKPASAARTRQLPLARTSRPGLAPVSSPSSNTGVPATRVAR